MNFKGNPYVVRPLILISVAIGSIVALSYCTKKEMPMVNEPADAGYKHGPADAGSNNLPEKELLEVGVYIGAVDRKPVEYEVYNMGNCGLKLYVSASKSIQITDYACDNTADVVEGNRIWGLEKYRRCDLEKVGETEEFDSLLREGQKLVRPENNKVKHDLQKALDDLLRP